MLILNKNPNILNDSDFNFLEEICQNFEVNESPNFDKKNLNYFYRHFIKLDDERASNIIKELTSYTNNTLNTTNLKIRSMWVNRVDSDSNKDDSFHKDASEISLIIYLNDGYSGGEFEYIDDITKQKIKIQVEKGTSLLINDKLEHRVLPVQSGTRYSLACFYTYVSKTNNSLI